MGIFDNWYTSISLVSVLYNKYNIGVLATVNSNRAGVPAWAFRILETLRGNSAILHWRCMELNVLSDSKIVGGLMSVELPGPQLVAMTRKHRKGKSKKQDDLIKANLEVLEETDKYMRIQVQKPKFFPAYNADMQWVDVKGAKSREYAQAKKSKRWQPKVYEAFSDLVLGNAVEIYKRLNPGEPMTVLEARKQVMNECFEVALEKQYWVDHRKKKKVNSI